MKKRKKTIKVLNALIVDNRPESIIMKYDGMKHVMKTSEAQDLYFVFRQALTLSSPDEHKEIELDIKGIDTKLCLLRDDIYNMWIKLKHIFRITF